MTPIHWVYPSKPDYGMSCWDEVVLGSLGRRGREGEKSRAARGTERTDASQCGKWVSKVTQYTQVRSSRWRRMRVTRHLFAQLTNEWVYLGGVREGCVVRCRGVWGSGSRDVSEWCRGNGKVCVQSLESIGHYVYRNRQTSQRWVYRYIEKDKKIIRETETYVGDIFLL